MKGMNIKKYLFIIAICAVIALIVYSSGTNKSSTNAAYRTEVNGSDGARVAKWDINSLDKDGAEMSLSADVQNIEKGSGNWFLEIENLSEVTAKYGAGTKIGLRLDSDVFGLKSFGNDNPWNFIETSGVRQNNPIKFVVYFYDCPLSDVLSYTITQGGVPYNKTIAEYLAMSESEKAQCVETISSVEGVKVLDTSAAGTIQLDHTTVTEGGIVTNYLYQEFDLSTLLSTISNFGIDSNTKKCIRIYWEIDESVGSISGTTDKFNVYNMTDGSVSKELDLFDYQKYISSLKGEPSYELDSVDGKITVRHSRLSQDQIDDLSVKGDKTGFELYQHLTYVEYEKFNQKQKEYLQQLGYLECGLSCSIIFSVKVEQVD